MSQIKSINWKALPGPENIYRTVLSNGITLLTRSNFNSPSVFVSGYMASGSRFDPLPKLGLAHYTAMCLMRGTQQRNFQQIYDALESAGASLGFGASVHNVNFGGRALVEDLPLVLQLLSEALCTPAFPTDQVERLRAQILTSLAIRDQDTSDLADMAFDEILFPDHPYGRPEDGYPETIQAISRDDLLAFHRNHYGPNGMVLVAVGAVEAQRLVDLVQDVLGGWANSNQETPPKLPPILPLAKKVRKHIPVPGKIQTDLSLGVTGPKRTAPDYMSASLGNSILGQFGMMGRIGDSVREKAGLAYHASAGLSATMEGGSWEVSAGVNPANLQRAIDLIIQELKRFTDEPVTPDELQDSQANYIGRLPLSLESNAGVANALLNIERFQLGLDYYQRYASLVQAVTPEMIQETAQRYWRVEHLAIVSAGPAEEATGPEKKTAGE